MGTSIFPAFRVIFTYRRERKKMIAMIEDLKPYFSDELIRYLGRPDTIGDLLDYLSHFDPEEKIRATVAINGPDFSVQEENLRFDMAPDELGCRIEVIVFPHELVLSTQASSKDAEQALTLGF